MTTKKGTELPLIILKGKDYLQVAQRIVWFSEENDNFSISTSFPSSSEVETVAKVEVTIYNGEGVVVKRVTAHKRETKSDFGDHMEKAETGALGRALALLGYGTQFATVDLDEGERIVDSPQNTTFRKGAVKKDGEWSV
jgi:hypothetical protein